MKRAIMALMCIAQVGLLSAQLNMNFLGQFEYQGQEGLDIWGYVDENNNEYAIMTVSQGVSIVDVTNPTSPNEVFFANGINAGWRDAKSWNDKAYIVNESGDGLMIIDLGPLPGSTNLTVTYYTGNNFPFTTAHNIYVDENGYAYLFGADYESNGVKSTVILNLNLPTTDPNFEAGVFDGYYIHDGMVRGDTLWAGAVNDGFFSAIDVTNKANGVTLGTKNTPNNFSHNCWVSDDGQTVFTTDEVGGAYLTAYDVTDLNNITELDRIQSSPGQNVIPHNVHVIGDFIVTSYYRDGVVAHDVSNPSNMAEVANYDTSPLTGNGFNGCWGVYPWLPSGNIIASDIEGGLFVLGITYVGASYLEGNVTNLNTAGPLDNVLVEVLGTSATTNTNIIGNYSVGIATPGTYDVVYSKAGFKTDTINNVVITANNTTTQDAQLEPLPSFTLQGEVVEAGTGNPIQGAQVVIKNNQVTENATTNASGTFSIANFNEGTFEITAGKWGYITSCSSSTLDENTGVYTITLDKGYYDDFSLDFNWNVIGSANAGIWERGVPVGTSYGPVEVNPGYDVSGDCGDMAYVTGNGGGSAGTDDVDDGNTVLTSPLFDATLYNEAIVEFDRWFYTGGGGSNSNDELVISLNNGITQVQVDMADVNSNNNSSWVHRSYLISDYLTPTPNMRLVVETADDDPGHLVEAGLDKFMVLEGNPVGLAELNSEVKISMQPNPFKSLINVQFEDVFVGKIMVIDVTGKVVENQIINEVNNLTLGENLDQGVYFVNVYQNDRLIKIEKIVKQ